ncbi:MAG: peptide chain release factor N(5)-glutamine methyltransferase [Acidimicrobiia bacterium]|nr:peptide chain release factor N(5)-glutamine methyltransferase [Acidimicrobiia bacterium]
MTPAGAAISGSGLPRHEAERLLATAAGSRVAPFAAVTPAAIERFERLVARRVAGEPLQYLEGTVQFGPLELLCDRRALIPRPETELLWEMASIGPAPAVIVDLCTGSGCLALACKHAFPAAEVHGADLSSEALALARENAGHVDLDVSWHRGDLFAALPDRLRGSVDLLVANPPYVARGDLAGLPDDVRDHEPEMALVSGPTGLETLERLAAELGDWLAPGARFLIEIGETQATSATALFAPFGPVVHPDLAGRPRIVEGRRRAGSLPGS